MHSIGLDSQDYHLKAEACAAAGFPHRHYLLRGLAERVAAQSILGIPYFVVCTRPTRTQNAVSDAIYHPT